MDVRIVVIDNDDSMRDLVSLCLKKVGRQIFSYAYADISLAAIEELRPDLIILDFNLKDDGIGWQFLQILKMEDAIANIPILITTTQLYLSAEVQSYLSFRQINVLQKPFDLDAFQVLVQKALMSTSSAGVIFTSDHTLPVLVVDDNDDLRETFALVLRVEGYQVTTADNGLVALAAVSRAEHSLILLDIDMPVMNGHEFLSAYNRQLRPHSPVIIITAGQAIRKHTLPSFVVDVIPKPFEIPHLLSAVGKYAQPVV